MSALTEAARRIAQRRPGFAAALASLDLLKQYMATTAGTPNSRFLAIKHLPDMHWFMQICASPPQSALERRRSSGRTLSPSCSSRDGESTPGIDSRKRGGS